MAAPVWARTLHTRAYAATLLAGCGPVRLAPTASAMRSVTLRTLASVAQQSAGLAGSSSASGTAPAAPSASASAATISPAVAIERLTAQQQSGGRSGPNIGVSHPASSPAQRARRAASLHRLHEMMKAASNNSDYVSSKRILQEFFDEGFQPSWFVYKTLLTVAVKTNHYGDVCNIINIMRGHSLVPELETYNSLIGLFGRRRNMGLVLLMLDDMQRDGIQPNMETFVNTFSAYLKCRMFGQAFEYMNSLRASGTPVTQLYFRAYHDIRFADARTRREVLQSIWMYLRSEAEPVGNEMAMLLLAAVDGHELDLVADIVRVKRVISKVESDRLEFLFPSLALRYQIDLSLDPDPVTHSLPRQLVDIVVDLLTELHSRGHVCGSMSLIPAIRILVGGQAWAEAFSAFNMLDGANQPCQRWDVLLALEHGLRHKGMIQEAQIMRDSYPTKLTPAALQLLQEFEAPGQPLSFAEFRQQKQAATAASETQARRPVGAINRRKPNLPPDATSWNN